jgi:hypothetical protein
MNKIVKEESYPMQQKRRKQPERYVQLGLKLIGKFME